MSTIPTINYSSLIKKLNIQVNIQDHKSCGFTILLLAVDYPRLPPPPEVQVNCIIFLPAFLLLPSNYHSHNEAFWLPNVLTINIHHIWWWLLIMSQNITYERAEERVFGTPETRRQAPDSRRNGQNPPFICFPWPPPYIWNHKKISQVNNWELEGWDPLKQWKIPFIPPEPNAGRGRGPKSPVKKNYITMPAPTTLWIQHAERYGWLNEIRESSLEH